MYCNSCGLNLQYKEIEYCISCNLPMHKECANYCKECGEPICDTCYLDNNGYCDECAEERKAFKKIRRSYIDDYKNCPLKLKKQVILEEPIPMPAKAQAGIIFHSVVEKMQLKEIDFNAAKATLINEIDEWNCSGQANADLDWCYIEEDVKEKMLDCLKEWVKWDEKEERSNEFEIEKSIRIKTDDDIADITCTLDRIDFINGDVYIKDWKTGSNSLSGKALSSALQPAIYIYACYKEFGKWAKEFALYYLQKGGKKVYEYVSDGIYRVKTSRAVYELNVLAVMEDVYSLLKLIAENSFPPTEKTWYCERFCYYGIRGKCKHRELYKKWDRMTYQETFQQ